MYKIETMVLSPPKSDNNILSCFELRETVSTLLNQLFMANIVDMMTLNL